MKNMTVEEILKAVNGRLLGAEEGSSEYKDILAISVDDISMNSREAGERDIFVPLVGTNVDAHRFIDGALEKANVTFTDSHAIIKGERGSYNIHLGSGVIHQEGGPMINVLPVHSQHRGRIFLPFVDDDPKTAEIMSKIIFFAEDKKIKDPFILDQIV